MRVTSHQSGLSEGDFITIYLPRHALIYRLEYLCVTFVRMGTLKFTDVRNHIRFFPTGANIQITFHLQTYANG